MSGSSYERFDMIDVSNIHRNATNTPDYTLREALKAVQEENVRLLSLVSLLESDLQASKAVQDSFISQNRDLYTNLLDREKWLKRCARYFDRIEQMTYSNNCGVTSEIAVQGIAACNLDLPLEE